MNIYNSTNQVELVVPMLPDIEIPIIKTAAAIAEYMGFDRDKTDELQLALTEACINSFEHSKSKDNKLYLKFIMHDRHLTVIIKDNGRGFNINSVEKPEIDKKIKSDYKRGWGITLIKNLMDDVNIESSAEGTTLVMTKVKQTEK